MVHLALIYLSVDGYGAVLTLGKIAQTQLTFETQI